ncbi:MAG: hypothetical protein AAAC47_29870 [Pararhizobium sp.]
MLIAVFFKKEVCTRKKGKHRGIAHEKATYRKNSEERTSKCPKRFEITPFLPISRRSRNGAPQQTKPELA